MSDTTPPPEDAVPSAKEIHGVVVEVAKHVMSLHDKIDTVLDMMTAMSSQGSVAALTAQRVTSLEVGTMRQVADVHGRIDIVERSVSVLDETVAALRNGGGH